MNKYVLPGLVFGVCLGFSGCDRTDPAAVSSAATGDPANGNLAPVDQTAQNLPNTYQSQPYRQGEPPVASSQPTGYTQAPPQRTAPPPPNYSSSYAGYQGSESDQNDSYGYDDYAPGVETTEPPPALPEYSQPACPGENYIWNPGYWSYASAGYYWVPGVWVIAPYTGALWTPPYWGFDTGRYRWHRGFWGTHVGFYGGIDYGFGYVGHGYYGGYWNHGEFAYNRSVTNINTTVVRNVYNYNVTNVTSSRVSYNGGPGGLRIRPLPQEVAVLHEQRMAPVAAQVEHARQFEANRGQFAAVNHGRPADVVAARPLQTDYRAPAARPNEVAGHPAILAPRAIPVRPGPQQSAPAEMRAQAQPNRFEPNRLRPNETRPNEPAPQSRPFTPVPAAPLRQNGRPEPQSIQQQRTAPPAQQIPAMRPETRAPLPAQHQEARPASQFARPAPQAPPQPQMRQEMRPAQMERPQQRPAPQAPPQPQMRQEMRPAPMDRPQQRPAPQAPPQPQMRQEMRP